MRKASSKLPRSFSNSGAGCLRVRVDSNTAKAMATSTSPTQISAGYIVENHSGSSDIHQSMAAKLAVNPRPIRPSTLPLRRGGMREIPIQTLKYSAARTTKKGTFKYSVLKSVVLVQTYRLGRTITAAAPRLSGAESHPEPRLLRLQLRPMVGRNVFERRVLAQLEGADICDNRPAIRCRNLRGVRRHRAKAIGHDVEEVAR